MSTARAYSHPSPDSPPALPRRAAGALRVRPDPPGAGQAWDRVQFDGPDLSSPAGSEPAGPRLVWSNGATTELPPATDWAATLVRAAVEILMGQRPAAQLTRYLEADLWTALNRRALLGVHVQGAPAMPAPVHIRRVHGCQVATTTWECSVVVHDGERVRAGAVRLELKRGRWRATALRIG